MNSITVKMKMLVSGWDQEWLKVSFFFFFAPSFLFFTKCIIHNIWLAANNRD